MRHFLSTSLLGAILLTPITRAAETPAELANPIIDTIRPRIDFFASASVPFGMVALHPDTHHKSALLWNSGYRYGDKRILFFTHSHMVQTPGVSTMPVTGPCKGNLGIDANSSAFSHDDEVVRPGYHKVKLIDSGITAEVTATNRIGMHRNTFPACEEAHVLFELTGILGDVKINEASAKQVSPTRIVGSCLLSPTGRRQKMSEVFFVAEFQKPFTAFAGWRGKDMVAPKEGTVAGKNMGAYVTYRNLKEGDQLLYKVALSYVSIEGAARNLQAELPGWDFDSVSAAATKQWNDYLGRIDVTGGTKEHRVKFYTDLMHTAIGRRTYSDVDGSYMDRGGKAPVVRKIPAGPDGKPAWTAIDMDCLWGTHWNLNILWTTVYPDYGNDAARTLVEYYKNNGMLGRGQWGGDENFTMTGDTSLPLLAALSNNGRARFDVEDAYEGVRKNAFPGGVRDHFGYELEGKSGTTEEYIKNGYISLEVCRKAKGAHKGSTARTLEDAYADWCLAQMAKQLGKKDDVELFTKRSENWRNVFDPSVGWMRPRHANGTWQTPFQPADQSGRVWTDYYEPEGFIEGTAAMWSYYVPQNMGGLVEAMGGSAPFVEKLEKSFTTAKASHFINTRGYIDFTNQPACHLAHLFNYGGAPWKSQYWVRQVKEQTFGGTDWKSGYHGDEDEGQMGGLGVLMATGLFSTQGCVGENPQMELTSPWFDSIRLHLPAGDDFSQRKTFDIKVTRSDVAKDIYIQSVKLNGKVWNDFKFPVRDLLAGGTMEIVLGSEPNKTWGVQP